MIHSKNVTSVNVGSSVVSNLVENRKFSEFWGMYFKYDKLLCPNSQNVSLFHVISPSQIFPSVATS